MENLSTQFGHFRDNTQHVTSEIQRIREKMDSLIPKSSFSPCIKQRSNPFLIIGSLAIFVPATLLFNALAVRIILSSCFILALYEAITMSTESCPNEQGSVISSAGIGTLCLVAIINIWRLNPSEILILTLLVISARALGDIIDHCHEGWLLPHPCPNLCLQKTWPGIVSATILPAIVVFGAIWLQWLEPKYWSFAGIGLATVLADLIVALIKRHYGFRYSSQAAHFSPTPSKQYASFLHRHLGDERGLLDRFAPFILSSTLLLFCLKL